MSARGAAEKTSIQASPIYLYLYLYPHMGVCVYVYVYVYGYVSVYVNLYCCSGFGFRLQGSGIRISGSEYTVSGALLLCAVPGYWGEVSGLDVSIRGTK